MTLTIETRCRCGAVFHPRAADVKRGWGKFCSKSCKAKKQAFTSGVNGPDDRALGRTVKQMSKGKYAKSQFKTTTRKSPWDAAGVSKETFLHYAQEYGGYPIFNARGEYDGFIPGPFDNSTDIQNSDPNE